MKIKFKSNELLIIALVFHWGTNALAQRIGDSFSSAASVSSVSSVVRPISSSSNFKLGSSSSSSSSSSFRSEDGTQYCCAKDIVLQDCTTNMRGEEVVSTINHPMPQNYWVELVPNAESCTDSYTSSFRGTANENRCVEANIYYHFPSPIPLSNIVEGKAYPYKEFRWVKNLGAVDNMQECAEYGARYFTGRFGQMPGFGNDRWSNTLEKMIDTLLRGGYGP